VIPPDASPQTRPSRIIAPISIPMLPVGTSSHARKTSCACARRLSAAKMHAIVLAQGSARSVHHHSLLMAQPYGANRPFSSRRRSS
jgi:hypothetical protein